MLRRELSGSVAPYTRRARKPGPLVSVFRRDGSRDSYWLFAVVLLPLNGFHEAFCAFMPLVVPHMIVSPFAWPTVWLPQTTVFAQDSGWVQTTLVPHMIVLPQLVAVPHMIVEPQAVSL
jgi:hypothetical protein